MIAANYFDGRSARLYPVELETSAAGVALAGPGIAMLYPTAEVTLAEPFEHASAALYFADGARCEVADRDAARQIADALGYRKPRVVRWQARWPVALLALIVLLATIGAGAVWGVPWAADKIAVALPRSVDRALGEGALRALEQQGVLAPSRFSEQRVAELETILRRIVPPDLPVPARLLVRASPQLGANALALPDGTIIITDAMVRYILGKEQDIGKWETAALAGVLGHEIGHLQRRHSTRVMARTSLTAAGSAALFGDFSAVAATVPALLMNMRYSREMETEADDYALALLRQHGLSAEPLAVVFDALDKDGQKDGRRNMPAWMAKGVDFAASHPSGAERSARLRRGGR